MIPVSGKKVGSVKISVSDRIGDGNLQEDQKREVWFEHC